MLNKKHMNHDLHHFLNFSNKCTFYKCNKCDKVFNFIIDYNEQNEEYVDYIQYEEVKLDNAGSWYIDNFIDDEINNLTCEEQIIKNLLE